MMFFPKSPTDCSPGNIPVRLFPCQKVEKPPAQGVSLSLCYSKEAEICMLVTGHVLSIPGLWCLSPQQHRCYNLCIDTLYIYIHIYMKNLYQYSGNCTDIGSKSLHATHTATQKSPHTDICIYLG